MPMSYILQQLDTLKNEINRLERFCFNLKSESREDYNEIKELKNRIQLLEQSHSGDTDQQKQKGE